MRLILAILSLTIFSSVRGAAVLVPVDTSPTIVDEVKVIWPETAHRSKFATRAPGDLTNAQRLRRGLPIAPPRNLRRVKRLVGAPAVASGLSSTGQITRYSFKQCQADVSTSQSSDSHTFSLGDYDGTPQDLANRCASLQPQPSRFGSDSGSGFGSGSGSGSTTGFAISIDQKSGAGRCMTSVTPMTGRNGKPISQGCTQTNSAYYAPA